MKNRKSIIVCADDFGFNAEVSSSLITLARKQRLSAISCMVNGPAFKDFALQLLSVNPSIQTGLHLTLTEGAFLSDARLRFSLQELLIKTHLGLIKPSWIAKECDAQLNAFIDIMGRMPHFMDGHQHVHQFPIIRERVLEIHQRRLSNQTYIRSTYPALGLKAYRVKAEILAWTGGRRLHRQLNKQGISHNAFFAGIYDFAPDTNYRALFRQWLRLASDKTLIMCHPAFGSSSTSDAIAKARAVEMRYFMSDDFLEDCHEFQVSLV